MPPISEIPEIRVRQKYHYRAKVAGLARDRDAEDPELIEARRSLKFATTAEHLARALSEGPPLAVDQMEGLVRIARAGAGSGSASREHRTEVELHILDFADSMIAGDLESAHGLIPPTAQNVDLLAGAGLLVRVIRGLAQPGLVIATMREQVEQGGKPRAQP